VRTAAYIRNRCPSKSLGGKMPEEVFSGKRPDLSGMRVFGCIAYAHVPDELSIRSQSEALSLNGIQR